MTLENCYKLLKHYEALCRGENIPKQNKHAHLVIANAKIAAEDIKKKIEKKLTMPQYANLKKDYPEENINVPAEKRKPKEVKKNSNQ